MVIGLGKRRLFLRFGFWGLTGWLSSVTLHNDDTATIILQVANPNLGCRVRVSVLALFFSSGGWSMRVRQPELKGRFMKTFVSILLLIVGLSLGAILRTPAESPRQTRAAILIGYELTYGPITHDEQGNAYRPVDGAVVSWISCNSGTPEIIAPGLKLGDAVKTLLEQGFRIEQQASPYQCLLTR